MLKPLYDQVVLESSPEEKKTQSGIILTAKDTDAPSIATVVAIGEGRIEEGKRLPLAVSVGDRVVYKRYATTEIKIHEKTYLIVKESDILAIVEEDTYE